MKCFVISPIGEEGSDIRIHADEVFDNIIQPALENFKIEPVRSDRMNQAGKISDQMYRAIFEYDLCIAVLTFANPNVYYELAVAQSASRPVIILIDKGSKLPFDVKDFRSLTYDLKISTFKEKTHINRLISMLEQLKQAGWRGDDVFRAYRGQSITPKESDIRNADETEFFASSGDFGGDSRWLELLNDTKENFDIMGVALLAWRQTQGFRDVVLQKAKNGCKVRVLLMHHENPVLPLQAADLDMLRTNIPKNLDFYRMLSKENSNIQVRQIRDGLMYYLMTRTDQYAVIIQFLSSQKWGKGPLWKCIRDSALYKIATNEFEFLWSRGAEE